MCQFTSLLTEHFDFSYEYFTLPKYNLLLKKVEMVMVNRVRDKIKITTKIEEPSFSRYRGDGQGKTLVTIMISSIVHHVV